MAERINENNLNSYVFKSYKGSIYREKKNIIDGIKPLLQKNYGDPYDCTLTSITTIIAWKKPELPIEDIYFKVEQIAKKYLYNGKKWGTLPIFIKPIYDEVLKEFKINKKTKFKYFKNISFTFDYIMANIDANVPVILSLTDDGYGYYKNHSVTIIGYDKIQTDNKKIINMLLIYDNWYKTIGYIDYNKLNIICGINC